MLTAPAVARRRGGSPRPLRATRRSAGVAAAIGTAAAGALLALYTGLGHGIGNASEGVDAVSTSSVVTTTQADPADPAAR